MTDRSESDMVAAPACPRADAALSCCSADSSCERAAASDSRAARMFVYCVFTWSAMLYCCATSFDSAASTSALRACTVYRRWKPSKSVRLELKPVRYDQGGA